MRRILASLAPTDRWMFLRSAALLVGASAGLVAFGYVIALPFDSMVVLAVAVVAAGAVFVVGGAALVWLRFRAMGYRPLLSTIAYLAAVSFAANLLTNRAFEAKLLAIPFVIAALLPFVVTGRAGKKNPPEPGDHKGA